MSSMTASSLRQSPWDQRLEQYFQGLQAVLTEVSEALADVRIGTRDISVADLHASHERLSGAVSQLESQLALRHELIHASDVPASGDSLHDILKSADRESLPRAADLIGECERLMREVDLAREQATAVFVCQFQLNDLTETILCLLRGAPNPSATYDSDGGTRRPAAGSGSLLNQSA